MSNNPIIDALIVEAANQRSKKILENFQGTVSFSDRADAIAGRSTEGLTFVRDVSLIGLAAEKAWPKEFVQQLIRDAWRTFDKAIESQTDLTDADFVASARSLAACDTKGMAAAMKKYKLPAGMFV